MVSTLGTEARYKGFKIFNLQGRGVLTINLFTRSPCLPAGRQALKALSASVSLRSQMKSYALNLFACLEMPNKFVISLASLTNKNKKLKSLKSQGFKI